MNIPINKPRNPVYRIQPPVPQQVIIDSIMEHIKEKNEANRYLAQQKFRESVTPTSLTDPLLNLKVRDYYAQKEEQNIWTESIGRLEGAGIGALIGAGITLGLAGIVEAGGFVLAPFTGGASIAGATAIASTIASTSGAMAIMGAGVGAATSDYTTYGATKALIKDTIIDSFKQGVGYGTLKTMSVIGKTTDLIEGGEAIRATLASAINGEDISEAILNAYGLNKKEGRTVYDFEKVRESMDIDLGSFGNTIFDLTGDLVTDPGFLAAVGKGLTGISVKKEYAESIQASSKKLEKYVVDASILGTDSENSIIKQLSKTVLDDDLIEFKRLLNLKDVKKSDEFITKYFNKIREEGTKKAAYKAFKVFDKIDNFDDAIVRWGNRIFNPVIGSVTAINKGLPFIASKLPENKFFNKLLGNGRYKSITEAVLKNAIEKSKINKLYYNIDTSFKFEDIEEDLMTKEEAEELGVRSVYELKKLLYNNHDNIKAKEIEQRIIDNYKNKLDSLHKELKEINDKIEKGSNPDLERDLQTNISELFNTQSKLDYMNHSYVYSRANHLVTTLNDIVKYTKNLHKETDKISPHAIETVQKIFNELLELEKVNQEEVTKIMSSRNASKLIDWLKGYISDEFTNSLKTWYGENKDKYTKIIYENSQIYREQYYKELISNLDDELKTKLNNELNKNQKEFIDYTILKKPSKKDINKIIGALDELKRTQNQSYNFSFSKSLIELEDQIKTYEKSLDSYTSFTNYFTPTRTVRTELFSHDLFKDSELQISQQKIQEAIIGTLRDEQRLYAIKEFLEKNEQEIISSYITNLRLFIRELYSVDSNAGKTYATIKSFKNSFESFKEYIEGYYHSLNSYRGTEVKNIYKSKEDFYDFILDNLINNSESKNNELLKDLKIKNTKNINDKLFNKNVYDMFTKKVNSINDIRKRAYEMYNSITYMESFRHTLRNTYNQDFIKDLNSKIEKQFKSGLITYESYDKYKKLIEYLNKDINKFEYYLKEGFSYTKTKIKDIQKEFDSFETNIKKAEQLQLDLAINTLRIKDSSLFKLKDKIQKENDFIIPIINKLEKLANDKISNPLEKSINDILNLIKNKYIHGSIKISFKEPYTNDKYTLSIFNNEITFKGDYADTTNGEEALLSFIDYSNKNYQNRLLNEIYNRLDKSLEINTTNIEALNTNHFNLEKQIENIANNAKIILDPNNKFDNLDLFNPDQFMYKYLQDIENNINNVVYSRINGSLNIKSSKVLDIEKDLKSSIDKDNYLNKYYQILLRQYLSEVNNTKFNDVKKLISIRDKYYDKLFNIRKIREIDKSLKSMNINIDFKYFDFINNTYHNPNLSDTFNTFINNVLNKKDASGMMNFLKDYQSTKLWNSIPNEIRGSEEKVREYIDKYFNKGKHKWCEASDLNTKEAKEFLQILKNDLDVGEYKLKTEMMFSNDYTMNLNQKAYNCFVNTGDINQLYFGNTPKSVKNCRFIYVDTEGTGHDPSNREGLLSAAYKVIEWNESKQSFIITDSDSLYISKDTFEKTGWSFSDSVKALNKNRTDEEMFRANSTYTPDDIRKNIYNKIKSYNDGKANIMVAHNAKYDFGMLNRTDNMYSDITTLDTLSLYRMLNLSEFDFNINENVRYKNSELGSVFNGLNYVEYKMSDVDKNGNLINGHEHKIRFDNSKDYVLEKHYYKDGSIEYRLRKTLETESRALHDGDVDTELSSLLFSNVLNKLSNSKGYENITRYMDLIDQSDFDSFLLRDNNKLKIDSIYNILNDLKLDKNIKEYELLNNMIHDLKNDNSKYTFDTLYDIKNTIDTVYNNIKKLKNNETNVFEDYESDLELIYNAINNLQKEYLVEKNAFNKLLNNSDNFVRQVNTNYVNLDLVNIYNNNFEFKVLKNIINGNTDYFALGSQEYIISKAVKDNNLQTLPALEKLNKAFQTVDRSVDFYINAITNENSILKRNPLLLDKFQNMIDFVEYNSNNDLDLLSVKFDSKFMCTYKTTEKYIELKQLKDLIFDYIKTVPKGEKLIVQPTTVFQAEVFTDLEDTIGQAIKSLANSKDNFGYINTEFKQIDERFNGKDGLLQNALKSLREYLSNTKKENARLKLDMKPIQLIQNGIENPYFGTSAKETKQMLRPNELISLNSKYTIKYLDDDLNFANDLNAYDNPIGFKKGASLKRIGNNIIDSYGLFKPYDNSNPDEFYIARQQETTIGRLFNNLSNIFRMHPHDFIHNASAYKVEYTDYTKAIENIIYNKKDFLKFFPGMDENQFKEIQTFLLELNSLDEVSLSYINDIQKFKNIYKAYLIDGLVNRYDFESGFKDYMSEAAKQEKKATKYYRFKRMYPRFKESSEQFAEFKKVFNSPEEFVDYLKNHKGQRLIFFNTEKGRFDDIYPTIENVTYALNDTNNMFSLISRDTYYKLTKEFNPNKLPAPKIVKYIDEFGNTITEDYDTENKDLMQKLKEIKNTEGMSYEILDKPGFDNTINKLKESFLIPLKIASLTWSIPFIVQNALTAAMQNMRQYEGPMNIFKFIKDASITNKKYQRNKALEETLLSNASFIKFATGKDGNYIKLIQRKNIIDELTNENVDQEIIDYIKKLKSELTEKDFKEIELINNLLGSNAVRGEISDLQSNMLVGETKRKDWNKLTPDEKIIYNNKPNTGFNSLEEELKYLRDKNQSKLTNVERKRINEINRLLNDKKYAIYKVFNTRFAKSFMNINEDLERVVRLQLILDLMEQGYSKEDSLSKVIDTHFIYDNKTIIEQYAEFIVPFISYPIRAANQLDELLGDYDFYKMMYLWDRDTWNNEESENSNYLTKRRARGDIPVSDKLLQVGNPLMETMTNVNSPLYALNNKLNPAIKPFVDLISGSEYNRLTQFPGISQAKAIYDIGSSGNPLAQFTTDYYKSSRFINYYLPRMSTNYPKFYSSLYTRTGYSRVAMNMSNLNKNNLYYRVNAILNYNGPKK